MSILYPDLPLVGFPNIPDSFVVMSNVTASDAPLIKQYFQAYQSGDIALAQQIYAQIPNADTKIVTATKINKPNEAIIALERFYQTDVQPYVTQKQQEWQNIINEFSYQNTYSTTAQYEVNNYVTYTSSGVTNLYICYVKPPIGTVPTNTAYWRVLTIRGVQGISGQGMAFMGEWLSTQPYTVMDCVTYDGALWGCIVANTNQPPFEGSTFWQLVYRSGVTIYPVSVAPPPIQQIGELWFKVLV